MLLYHLIEAQTLHSVLKTVLILYLKIGAMKVGKAKLKAAGNFVLEVPTDTLPS